MSNLVLIKFKKSVIDSMDAELILSELKAYLANRPNKDYLEYRNRFNKYLKSNKNSLTIERSKVLEKVVLEKNAFTTSIVHSKVLEDIQISERTIYYTFKLLIDAGIIKQADEFQKEQLFKTTYFELC